MKEILVLLKCPIVNQGRMINFINTLSFKYKVYLYFLDDDKANANNLFSDNVTLHPYCLKTTAILTKAIRHSFYWLEYTQLRDIVLKDYGDKKFDCIICHDLPVLYPAIELKKYYKTKLIYDSLEIYNETINQFFPSVSGFIKKSVARFLIMFMRINGTYAEKKMVQKADVMITVNRSLAKYFEKNYCLNEVEVIMNCPKYQKETPTSKVDFRQKYSFERNDKIFLYQGVLNDGRGLMLLVEAVNIAIKENPRIRLVIIGDGVLKEKLKERVKFLNLTTIVKFHGVVSYDELINYTVAADFGINLLEPFNLSKKLASPNKLFEYMQAEIPVLCSYSPENDLVFRKYNIGKQCENNIENIASGIVDLSNETENSLNGYLKELQKAKQEFNWEEQSKKLNLIFDRLI